MRFFVRPTSRHRRRWLVPESLEERVLLTTIRVTEINYNPYEPIVELGEGGRSDDYAFIEIANTGTEAVNLDGMRFDQGVDFDFGNVTLQPEERIVIVEDAVAFALRYGTNVNLAGEWSGNLDKEGETITLLAADDSIIQKFDYDTGGSWPGRADGLGATLEVKDVNGDYDKASNWRGSSAYGGTPGALPAEEYPVIINEVLAHTDLPQIDSIELYNPSAAPVDLSNWYLSDLWVKPNGTLESPTKFQIPAGTVIPADGYVVFDETDFNPGQGTNESDFALSEFGDEVWLMAGDGRGRPTDFVDDISFGASLNGVSLGLLPNGNTKSDFLPLNHQTLGGENVLQWPSPLVIDEVHYHPRNNDVNLEFIELRNRTQGPLDASDWRIEDAVQIVVPAATTIGADDRIVLVAFDPADAEVADAFRAAYGIGNNVTLLGPWGSNDNGEPKKLDNAGEKITLKGPVEDLLGTFYYVADQVDFDNETPWPIAADGYGGSLQRLAPGAFGNDGASWQPAVPSPGMEMQSAFSLHNDEQPLDVDGDGSISPFDALVVINYLNGVTLGTIYFFDTDNSGEITPFDVLLVINHLNAAAAAQGAAASPSDTSLVGAAIDVDDPRDSEESHALHRTALDAAIVETLDLMPLDLRSDRVESIFKS